MVVLLAAVGLAVDGGRLLSNKSELQAAADACALGAVTELVCNATDPACLQRATRRGVAMAALNRRDLQGAPVTLTESDVTFSTTINGTFDKTQNASRFARCVIQPEPVIPSLLGVLGITSMQAGATATATLTSTEQICSNAPIALCPGTYTKGQWIQADYSAKHTSDYVLNGSFKWVTFDGHGASNISQALTAPNSTCVTQGEALTFPGVASSVSDEYNTRFGLYKATGHFNIATAPQPDKTGYAYPNSALPLAATGQPQQSAYADYLARRAANEPFNSATYDHKGNGNNRFDKQYTSASVAELEHYGGDRRLVTAVMPESCTSGRSTVKDAACVLLLNPMDNGNGSNTIPLYVEYLGKVSDPGSPCQISAVPGGSGAGIGNLVPTLVQ